MNQDMRIRIDPMSCMVRYPLRFTHDDVPVREPDWNRSRSSSQAEARRWQDMPVLCKSTRRITRTYGPLWVQTMSKPCDTRSGTPGLNNSFPLTQMLTQEI